jgi:hypothetical protein
MDGIGGAMSRGQIAGMIVVIAVIAGVDMRIDWLVPLAMMCGGVATYVVSYYEHKWR